MKINLEELRKRKDYISEQVCPEENLIIWSYKQKCQFDNVWDEYTLMARGLITDDLGNVISRPFDKFFNYEENKEKVPLEKPEILEKLDGSLGILYWDKEGVCKIATRGSFTSEQAVWATKKLKEYPQFFDRTKTYLFEIIYPENRIVIKYDFSDLVLLAIRDIETGKYLNYKELENEAEKFGFKIPFKYQNDDLEKLKTLSLENKEGFVVSYPNGLKLKIKFDEYVRLHRIVTGFSNVGIWDCLRNGQDINEYLDNIPDEFYKWVKENKEKLELEFKKLFDRALKLYKEVKNFPTRKEQALYIMGKNKFVSGAVFCLLDNKEDRARDCLWKSLKPKYEQPFKKEL